MLEQYLMTFLANNSFRYSAAIIALLGTTAWRVAKRLFGVILFLCAACIAVHCYFGMPYSQIFFQIRSFWKFLWNTVTIVFAAIGEFLSEARKNF